MKKTNRLWLALLLTVLVASLLAVGFTAAAADADYNWQPIPTSPVGLAEGAYYLDFTDYDSAMNTMTSVTHPTAADTWYFDEERMALKAEGFIPYGTTLYEDGVYKTYPDTMVKLSPDEKPVSGQYFVYRFLTKVGQNWVVPEYSMYDSSNTYYYNNIRLDYEALAAALVADDDTLTQADIPALEAALAGGEWMVDQDLHLLKGCYQLPDSLTQGSREAYRFVLPSQAYYESCVDLPLREWDFSNMSGQWNDNISWTLENSVLTISGTGKMERQTQICETGSKRSRLYFAADTVEFFGRSSTTSRRLLEKEIGEAALAHFGVENAAQLEAAVAKGLIDLHEYADYYYQQNFELVKTIIIEDGITSIGEDVFRELYPETIILPASLKSLDHDAYNKYSAFNLSGTKHIYFLDAASDFESLRLRIEGVAEACASLYEDGTADIDWRILESLDISYDWLQDSFLEYLSEVTLQEFCKIAYDIKSTPIGMVPTEEMIVSVWNRRTGDNYTSGDALLSDIIAWFNNRLDTQFTSVTDFFLQPPGLSTYSLERSEAYKAAYNSYYDKFQSQVAEALGIPDVSVMSISEAAWFGDALETPESGIAIAAAPWLTVHGYAGSTAETAAATSGVNFVPLCPNDYTHSVVKTPAVEPTVTAVGYTAGWYCETCGLYLSGHEEIDPAANNWKTITLDEPFTVSADENHRARVFSFTPSETARYTFVSDDGCFTHLTVYDSDFRPILFYPFDAASPLINLQLMLKLTAGETYYFEIECNSYQSSVGTFTLTTQPPHGACGDGLFWTFENDTLTISGTGSMPDYASYHPAPWHEFFEFYRGIEITVVLEAGVTRVGANAFPNTVLKELIVLNRDCDLSALHIDESVLLRGYLNSTAMTYANEHDLMSVFMPLCETDYRHTVEIIEGVDSTCKEPGHTPGLYCVECGKAFYGNETLPLENHTWGAWVTTKEATTETEGVRTRTCAVCDAKETQTIEKLTSTGNGGSDSSNDDGGFFGWLQRAMKGLVAWFQKLLRFFSK